jgi:hypothetical protein
VTRPPSYAFKKRPREVMMRHFARLQLRDARKRFLAGEKRAILDGLFWCAVKDGPPIPQWLGGAFIAAVHAVGWAEHRSWDGVFGQPYKKNAKLAAIRKRALKEGPVYHDVVKAWQNGADLNEATFEKVGRRHGIGRALTQKYYYDHRARMPADMPPMKRDPRPKRRRK